MKLSNVAKVLCLGASVLISGAALAHDPSIVLDWLTAGEVKQLDERAKREKKSDPYGAWYEAIDIAMARRHQAAERGETRQESLRRAEKEVKRPFAKYVNQTPGFLRRQRKLEAVKEAPQLSALIRHLEAYSEAPFAGDDPCVLMEDGNGELVGVDVEVHADADLPNVVILVPRR